MEGQKIFCVTSLNINRKYEIKLYYKNIIGLVKNLKFLGDHLEPCVSIYDCADWSRREKKGT